MNRRTFLALGSAAASVGLGGCLEDTGMSERGNGSDGPSAQFQSGARNAGVTAGDVPETVETRWQTTIDPVDGGLVVADGHVLVAAGGNLVALDADGGDELWDVDVGLDLPAAPAISDDVAYVTAWNGGPDQERGVAAIALDDGSELWRAIPDVDVSSAPTLADGTIYVGGSLNSEEVIALDADDGEELWRFRAGQYATTPAVAEGVVYVGGGSEHVAYALDADEGDELWRFDADDRVWGAPTVVGETVYVSDRSGLLYALDPDDGEEQWHARVGSDVRESVAATDDAVYVPADEGFVALDADDGEELWTADEIENVHTPAVAGDGIVVTMGAAGRLDAATGEVTWIHEVETRQIRDVIYNGIWCEPVVADGIVYIATHGGHVYALEEP